MVLINDLNNDSNKKSDEIISMFSQYFFDYFNSINKKEKIFWHGECFSIPTSKIKSYIKYKMGSIQNVFTTYYLKKKGVKNAGRIKLKEKIKDCEKDDFYKNTLKEIESGILYYKGERINPKEYLKGNIKPISTKPKEKIEVLDLTSWDW